MSFITCGHCESLLPDPERCKLTTCKCGASILCPSCFREKEIGSITTLNLSCGCREAKDSLNELQIMALKDVKIRCENRGCGALLNQSEVVKHDIFGCSKR